MEGKASRSRVAAQAIAGVHMLIDPLRSRRLTKRYRASYQARVA